MQIAEPIEETVQPEHTDRLPIKGPCGALMMFVMASIFMFVGVNCIINKLAIDDRNSQLAEHLCKIEQVHLVFDDSVDRCTCGQCQALFLQVIVDQVHPNSTIPFVYNYETRDCGAQKHYVWKSTQEIMANAKESYPNSNDISCWFNQKKNEYTVRGKESTAWATAGAVIAIIWFCTPCMMGTDVLLEYFKCQGFRFFPNQNQRRVPTFENSHRFPSNRNDSVQWSGNVV